MKFKILHLLSLVAIAFIVSSCNNDAEDSILNIKSKSRSIEDVTVMPTDVYPSVTEILDDDAVYMAMFIAWCETLSFASEEGRREVGFYIYYDFVTKKFSVGEIVYGPYVKYDAGTSASVNLGPAKDNMTVCAFFHTHTPLTYAPYDATRITGPSDEDKQFADSNKLPGILYDYAKPRIEAGHSPTDPTRIYTFGVTRRKNPLTLNSTSL